MCAPHTPSISRSGRDGCFVLGGGLFISVRDNFFCLFLKREKPLNVSTPALFYILFGTPGPRPYARGYFILFLVGPFSFKQPNAVLTEQTKRFLSRSLHTTVYTEHVYVKHERKGISIPRYIQKQESLKITATCI